jgi:hypothetical protein
VGFSCARLPRQCASCSPLTTSFPFFSFALSCPPFPPQSPAVLLQCLVKLHNAPGVKGMDEHMKQLADNAPSLPIKAVLSLVAKKVAVEREEARQGMVM